MASFENVFITQDSMITPGYLLDLQNEFQEIIRSQDTLKSKIISILKDKDVSASESESLSDLIAHFKDLQNANLNGSEYSENLINITETVKSGQAQFLFLDGVPASIIINTWLTDEGQTSSGSFQVDWGDGTIDTIENTSNCSHTFASGSGEKYDDAHNQHVVTVKALKGKINGIGAKYSTSLLAVAAKDIYMNCPVAEGFRDCTSLKYFDIFGGSFLTSKRSQSIYNYFKNCPNLERIKASVCWSSVTSLDSTFYGCNSLKTLDMGDVWNTVNCISFSDTFNSCTAIEELPGIVTNMTTTLSSTYNKCSALKRIKCDYFNLENCKNLQYTFLSCSSLEQIPKLLNTNGVTSFNNTFNGCTSLVKLQQETLDTSAAIIVNSMFYNCASLEEAPVMDFNSVTSNSQAIFSGCSNLYVTQKVFNFNSLVGTKPASQTTGISCGLDGMFYNCSSLTAAPTINAPHVLSINYLFAGCSNLVSVPKEMRSSRKIQNRS